MNKSNLIEILKSLTPNEFKSFGKYLDSPFFANNHLRHIRIKRLFSMLKLYYPEFAQLDWEGMYSRVCHCKDYHEKEMAKLKSELLKATEEYLACLNCRRNRVYAPVFLLDELRSRGIDGRLIHNLEQDENKLCRFLHEGITSRFFGYLLYECEREYRDCSIGQGNKSCKKFEKSFYWLTNLLVTATLRQFMKLGDEQKFRADFPEHKLVAYLIDYLSMRSDVLEQEPSAAVYYHCIMFEESHDVNHCLEIQRIILDRGFVLGREVLEDVCLFFQKYKDSNEFLQEWVSQLSAYLITRIGTKCHSKMTPACFLSILESLIEYGPHEWTKEFVAAAVCLLPARQRTDVVGLSEGILFFEAGQYGKALETIAHLKPNDLALELGVRNLKVRCYYELQYFDQLLGVIDCYKHFLYRNTHLDGEVVPAHLRFVHFLEKLLKCKFGNPNNGSQAIRTEVTTSSCPNKKWLLRKASELPVR